MDLKFIGRVFPDDVAPGERFSTVRRGLKWAQQVATGQMVQVIQCKEAHSGQCDGCTALGPMRIERIWQGALIDVPEDLLALNHDPAHREFESMRVALSEIYLEPGPNSQPLLSLEEPVTVLLIQP